MKRAAIRDLTPGHGLPPGGELEYGWEERHEFPGGHVRCYQAVLTKSAMGSESIGGKRDVAEHLFQRAFRQGIFAALQSAGDAFERSRLEVVEDRPEDGVRIWRIVYDAGDMEHLLRLADT